MFINIGNIRYVMPGRGRYWKAGGLKDSIITSADIKDATIVSADIKIFVSTEQTGSGSEQSVAHGLGATPTKVIVAVTEFGGSTAVDVAEGTHDGTNCKVTISSGVKYKIWAQV
jgi:hypothetical protein